MIGSARIVLQPADWMWVPTGPISDSIYLLRTESMQSAAASGSLRAVMKQKLVIAGRTIRELEFAAGDQTVVRRSDGGERFTATLALPLGKRVFTAAGSDDWIVIDSDTLGYLRYDAFGDLKQVVRIKTKCRRSTPADLAAYRSEYIGTGNAFWRALREEVIDGAKPGELMPVVDAAFVADDGGIWLREFGPGAEQREWFVFGTDGRAIGGVTLPAGIVVDVRGDRVLVIGTDELGIQTATVWRTRRTGTD